MKKNKIQLKKLVLKKESISKLNNSQMEFLNGGGNTVTCTCAGIPTCVQACGNTKTTLSKNGVGCTTTSPTYNVECPVPSAAICSNPCA